jgi:hypothetical protein
VLRKIVPLLVEPEVELEGLDIAETGVLAYPDFLLLSKDSFKAK